MARSYGGGNCRTDQRRALLGFSVPTRLQPKPIDVIWTRDFYRIACG